MLRLESAGAEQGVHSTVLGWFDASKRPPLADSHAVDEVIRPFASVLHSNDATARALTLRVLASLSKFAFGRLDLQHHVRQSFHSVHDIEVEAALFALERFTEVGGDTLEATYSPYQLQ